MKNDILAQAIGAYGRGLQMMISSHVEELENLVPALKRLDWSKKPIDPLTDEQQKALQEAVDYSLAHLNSAIARALGRDHKELLQDIENITQNN